MFSLYQLIKMKLKYGILQKTTIVFDYLQLDVLPETT